MRYSWHVNLHFADDTNLIIKNKSPKKITRDLNKDLRSLTKWLRSNKISLNAKKTELVIFREKWKKMKLRSNLMERNLFHCNI